MILDTFPLSSGLNIAIDAWNMNTPIVTLHNEWMLSGGGAINLVSSAATVMGMKTGLSYILKLF